MESSSDDLRLERAPEEGAVSTRFVLAKKNYTQFNNVYKNRINQMRPILRKEAIRKWGSEEESLNFMDKIIEAEANQGQVCVLIGTLYKEMELKPSVLDEFKDYSAAKVELLPNITSVSDSLILEDDSGRVKLKGMEAITSTLVTGVIVALKGCVDNGGIFGVVDWTTADETLFEDTPGITKSPEEEMSTKDEKYVLLVSGLELGSESESSMLPAQLFADFVSGALGGPNDIKLASQVVRVIVAGNSIAPLPSVLGRELRFGVQKDKVDSARNAKQFDIILAQLLGSCPVDLMPGPGDPVNLMMPQQPIHPCLLPHSSRFNTLRLVTNPYEANIAGVNFLGHSGQPIHDILMQTGLCLETVADTVVMTAQQAQSDNSRELEALCNTLRWAHLAPTAPDSLPCFPIAAVDPFVMTTAPQVLFAGNQPKFASKTVESLGGKSTKVVCVPSFKETCEVVILNLRTRECSPLSFSVSKTN